MQSRELKRARKTDVSGVERALTTRVSRAKAVALTLACAAALAGSLAGPAQAGTGSAPVPSDPTAGVLYSTSAISTDDVWSAGYAQGGDTTTTPLAEHWDGSGWTVTATPLSAGRSHGLLQGVTAITTKNAWAVGSSTSDSDGSSRTLAEHWNGKKWKVVPTAEPEGVSSSYLQSVTAISAHNVWAVGYYYGNGQGASVIEHWDGHAWSVVPSADPAFAFNVSLQGVSAVSVRDVWATGLYFDQDGAGVTLVEHWNGKKWRLVASPNSAGSPDTELHGVTAISADDAWATGYFFTGSSYLPLTEHWDGTQWSIVDTPTPTGSTNTYLYGVTALSAGNVWATGYYFKNGAYTTLVERWNGTKWRVVATPNISEASNSLFGVTAISAKDAWVTGYAFDNADIALTEHWDGKAWSIVQAG